MHTANSDLSLCLLRVIHARKPLGTAWKLSAYRVNCPYLSIYGVRIFRTCHCATECAMNDFEPALVLSELHVPGASCKPAGTGVPQHVSGTSCNTAVVKQESGVLIASVDDLSCVALYTPVAKPAITGVAVSPCGSMVAAYSADALYVASLGADRQLKKAAQLAGVKAVHWCPGRAVLAVFCQQVCTAAGVACYQPRCMHSKQRCWLQ